jgi:putative transposase
VGGTANHIHLLIRLNPTMPLAEAIQKLKANSSRWLSEQGILFEWQRGYGAFRVSPSQIPIVKNYIRNQEHHHRKRNFQEEFDLFLLRPGIPETQKPPQSSNFFFLSMPVSIQVQPLS